MPQLRSSRRVAISMSLSWFGMARASRTRFPSAPLRAESTGLRTHTGVATVPQGNDCESRGRDPDSGPKSSDRGASPSVPPMRSERHSSWAPAVISELDDLRKRRRRADCCPNSGRSERGQREVLRQRAPRTLEHGAPDAPLAADLRPSRPCPTRSAWS